MNSLARKSESTPRRLRRSGFTFLELLITMTIVSILLAIGVPSFQYVTSANRASGEINGLLGDLQFARGEAIKEGQTVTVCASTDGLTCSGAPTAWNTGWIVFSDAPPIGTIEGTDSILKVQRAFSGTDTLSADHAISAVTFSREGFTKGLGNSAVTVTLHTTPVNAQYTRCLSMTIIGALSTQINGKPTAESPNLCN
jgi:type IV fimbrial biogenesis protein FimT